MPPFSAGRALLPVAIEDGQGCPSYVRFLRQIAPLQGWFHAPYGLTFETTGSVATLESLGMK